MLTYLVLKLVLSKLKYTRTHVNGTDLTLFDMWPIAYVLHLFLFYTIVPTGLDLNPITLFSHWLDRTAWPAMGRCAVPSRRRDHQPCPKQHLQWARHRSPAGGSRFVGDGDDLEDVSMPVCHQVGDRHGSWQPDEVLRVRVLILADDVHDRILRFACLGFCCGCFVAVCTLLGKNVGLSRKFSDVNAMA